MPRKRKPDELKAREGNPGGGRSLNRADKPATDHVKPAADVPAPPPFVLRYPGAVAQWNALCPILAKMGVLASGDLGVAGRYAVALCVLEKATAALASGGLVMTYTTGARQVSAELSAWIKAGDTCAKCEAELGLTPAARTRVTTWGGNRPPASDTDGAEDDAPPIAKPDPSKIGRPPIESFRLTGS